MSVRIRTNINYALRSDRTSSTSLYFKLRFFFLDLRCIEFKGAIAILLWPKIIANRFILHYLGKFWKCFCYFCKSYFLGPGLHFHRGFSPCFGRQETTHWTDSTTHYYAVSIDICLFWSFYLLTLVKRSIFCHWAWYWRFYLHRRVGHLNCDIHIFIFIFIFLRYKAEIFLPV